MQVINFEMPQSAAGYVHRIGRTGRAYSTGASISLVSFLLRLTSAKLNGSWCTIITTLHIN